jgi:hypothetical protein
VAGWAWRWWSDVTVSAIDVPIASAATAAAASAGVIQRRRALAMSITSPMGWISSLGGSATRSEDSVTASARAAYAARSRSSMSRLIARHPS